MHVNDRYVLSGEKYLKLRDSITKCFQDRTTVSLEEEIKKNEYASLDRFFPYVAIAIYKNITTLYKDVEHFPIDMYETCLSKAYGKHKHHWEVLLGNHLTHNLKISKDTWGTIELSLLLVQLKFSILFSKSKLTRPLVSLMETPRVHKDSYLPCMPQDMMYDIHQAVRQGVRSGTENPTFYACPNNHPYVLFNCGQPWEVFTCKVCL